MSVIKNFNRQDMTSTWFGFWAAVFLISIPMLIPYLIGMAKLAHYHYFPFVFLLVGIICWNRISLPINPPRGVIAWSGLAIGLLLCGWALIVGSTWAAAVGFVFLGVSFLDSQSGPNDRKLLGLSIPLLMLIRLPFGLDQSHGKRTL